MAQDTRFVRGAERLGRRIDTIRTNLDMPDMMEAIQTLLLRRTLNRFDAERDPDEQPWEPLKRSTVERRQRSGKARNNKILHESGSLRGAIQIIRGAASGAVYTNTGAGFRIGIRDKEQELKARVHQQGIGVPQRRFLGIGYLDVKAVDGLLRRRAAKMGF